MSQAMHTEEVQDGENPPGVDALAHAHARDEDSPLDEDAVRLAALQPWKRAFILNLREKPNVDKARKAGTKLSRTTIYNHRESDPLFREMWDEAMEGHIDDAEETVHELGTVGDVRRTYRDGELVGEEFKRNADALKFYLSANRARYRETKGTNLQINIATGPSLVESIRQNLLQTDEIARKLPESGGAVIEAEEVK